MRKQSGPTIDPPAPITMLRTVHCPSCAVELTIPAEAGARRLRCPKCSTRFYPSPRSTSEMGPPPSSILIEVPVTPRSPARAKTPKSSGLHDMSGQKAEKQAPRQDAALRDLMEIPLQGDEDVAPPRGRGPILSDAEALFRDDPAPRAKNVPAEARRKSRRCPTCGDVVLGGMSLCSSCGLDLDTGLRHEVAFVDVDLPPATSTAVSGPPILVLVIGGICLLAGGVLGLLSMIAFDGLGRICLTTMCLFGVFASIEFLRGRNAKLLMIALLLGGAVNIVTMMILPVVIADVNAAPVSEIDAPEIPGSSKFDDRPVGIDTNAAPLEIVPLVERVDSDKLVWGTILLFADAILLVAISTPVVTRYFGRRSPASNTGPLAI